MIHVPTSFLLIFIFVKNWGGEVFITPGPAHKKWGLCTPIVLIVASADVVFVFILWVFNHNFTIVSADGSCFDECFVSIKFFIVCDLFTVIIHASQFENHGSLRFVLINDTHYQD